MFFTPPPPRFAHFSLAFFMSFCFFWGGLGWVGRAFSRTKTIKPGITIPTKINCYADRTYDFSTNSPPNSYFLKAAAGIEKGSTDPGNLPPVAEIHLKHIYEIAKVKKADANFRNVSLESMCKMLIGSCKSMGIAVQGSKWVPFNEREADVNAKDAIKE